MCMCMLAVAATQSSMQIHHHMPSISRCFLGGTALWASHPNVSRSGSGFLGAMKPSNVVQKYTAGYKDKYKPTPAWTTNAPQEFWHTRHIPLWCEYSVLMLTPATGRPATKTSVVCTVVCPSSTPGTAALVSRFHLHTTKSAHQWTSQGRGSVSRMAASTLEASNGAAPCAWYHEVAHRIPS